MTTEQAKDALLALAIFILACIQSIVTWVAMGVAFVALLCVLCAIIGTFIFFGHAAIEMVFG